MRKLSKPEQRQHGCQPRKAAHQPVPPQRPRQPPSGRRGGRGGARLGQGQWLPQLVMQTQVPIGRLARFASSRDDSQPSSAAMIQAARRRGRRR